VPDMAVCSLGMHFVGVHVVDVPDVGVQKTNFLDGTKINI
jgi:hypothetical protein